MCQNRLLRLKQIKNKKQYQHIEPFTVSKLSNMHILSIIIQLKFANCVWIIYHLDRVAAFSLPSFCKKVPLTDAPIQIKGTNGSNSVEERLP